MLTVSCVLKSGGTYDQSWVAKLKRGVERNLARKHKFVCFSDVDVPCDRIPLRHDWPGWWSKIELFSGKVEGEHLYLDLDTVCVGVIEILRNGVDFAALQSFWRQDAIGSGVMYFSGENVPHHIYEKFAKQPKAWIAHHERNANGTYVGDQAFISDCLGEENIERINDYIPGIKSYKMHCQRRLPQDASIVCFHGKPTLPQVDHDWVRQHWS